MQLSDQPKCDEGTHQTLINKSQILSYITFIKRDSLVDSAVSEASENTTYSVQITLTLFSPYPSLGKVQILNV